MTVLVPVLQFFQKRGVSEALSVYDLFNTVTGLDIPVGAEDESLFIGEVTDRKPPDPPWFWSRAGSSGNSFTP